MTPLTVLLAGSLHPPQNSSQMSGFPAEDAEEDFEKATKAYNENRPRFEAACQALGAAFARKHWRIMVGVPLWQQWTKRETIAPFVVEGVNSEKADKTTGPHPVIFYAPREPEKPTQNGPAGTLYQLEASHPNVKLEYKVVPHGVYEAKVIPNVAAVDAVVLVGGGDGTATIGYAAYSLERPVLAVAGFGGAAKTLLDDVLFHTYDRYKESVQLTDGDLLCLTASWNDKADDKINRTAAENVVNAAEKLVKAYALAGLKTTRVLEWAMAGMAVLLGLWVIIFLIGAQVALQTSVLASNAPLASSAQASGAVPPTVKPAVPTASKDAATNIVAATAEPAPLVANSADREPAGVAKGDGATAEAASDEAKPSPSGSKGVTVKSGKAPPSPKVWIPFVPVAFFSLLYISAALGTGLRVLVAFQSNQLTRLTGFAVWVELVVALSVAFGLALLYLVGSISFTGHVSMLASDAQNFPTVAVSMSLLGLTAGYLVPLDKLRDRLQKVFAGGEEVGTSAMRPS